MSEFNPYEAPQAELVDPASEVGFELADRGARLGATLLDGLLLWGTAGILAAIGIPMTIAKQEAGNWVPMVLVIGLILVAVLVIMAIHLVLLHRYGQTIGKRALGIRIARPDGSPASLGRIVGLRIIVAKIPAMLCYLGTIYSLTDACFIFREDRRCLHDLIADTIVVRA